MKHRESKHLESGVSTRTNTHCRWPQWLALLSFLCAAAMRAQSTADCGTSSVPCPSVTPYQDYFFIGLLCAAAAVMVVYPVLRFLFKQWSFRRDRIYAALKGDAVVHYYLRFNHGAGLVSDHPPLPNQDPACADTYATQTQDLYLRAFKRDFVRWYGRQYYTAPTFILAVLTAAVAWWAAAVLRVWTLSTPPDNERVLAMAALAGAFMWVISDELDRLRRRDFTSTDVYYYIFRVIIAVPFAWALSKARIGVDQAQMSLPITVPIAFFLGAFPTTTLFTFARRFVSQTLRLGEDPATGDLELEKLQSVVKSNAERFQDEDINTITGLAYADPIDLTIRTNFDLNYVIDCVSQALMWIYFEEESKELFQFSMRGAQEIAALVAWADGSDPAHAAAAQQALADAAALLHMNLPTFRATIDQIAEDPYTVFLVDIWT
jgi:hypothetical protein